MGKSKATPRSQKRRRRAVPRSLRDFDLLAWTHELPNVPGLYLRNNPPGSAVTRNWVYRLGDGERLRTTAGGAATDLVEWAGHGRFWWFGPIPDPPFESEPCDLKEGNP